MRRTSVQASALALLLVVLVFGVARLLGARSVRGDVYARYSTLRSDPLGARILVDALRRVDGVTVSRNTSPLRHLWDDPDVTVFFLGAAPSHLESEATDDDLEIEALARHGARVVIAVSPHGAGPVADEDLETGEGRDHGHGRGKTGPPDDEDLSSEGPKRPPFNKLLGFGVAHAPLPQDEEHEPIADVARRTGAGDAAPDLPETLPWHTILCFTDLAGGWRTIYARGGHAVLVEREFGRGSLVLSADTFVLSNEALAREPRAALVSWFVGDHRTIVFDETHLGVFERPGVVSLMRRYRLHAFVAAILLVAVLFVWRVSVPIVPPHDDAPEPTGEILPGRDAAAGLVTILRRGIPQAHILRVCRSEWTKAFQKRRPDLVAALEGWSGGTSDPVEGYRRIGRALREERIPHER
jgi:uncharacterized protein DUF4350